MPYNALIPQAPDILSDSQDDLLNNFTQLNAAWNTNHAAFNGNNPPQGTHTQVTLQALPNVAAPGGPTTTVANTINIWSATSVNTLNTELQLQRAPTVAVPVGPVIEWTGLFARTSGWTRLPSGILIKWGPFNNNTGVNPFPIVFPTMDAIGNPIPAFVSLGVGINNPFNIQVTPQPVGAIPLIVNVSATFTSILGFSVNTFLSNTGAQLNGVGFWLAIGI